MRAGSDGCSWVERSAWRIQVTICRNGPIPAKLEKNRRLYKGLFNYDYDDMISKVCFFEIFGVFISPCFIKAVLSLNDANTVIEIGSEQYTGLVDRSCFWAYLVHLVIELLAID